LPQSPDKINTTFALYNKQCLNGEMINKFNLGNCFLNGTKTKFITHGWLNTALDYWVLEMKDLIISVEESVNVIAVDWKAFTDYTVATADTQIVGVEIALLIEKLIAEKSMKAEDFHLIGHSLGAHISAYAGKRVQNLGRITGLDAAGPYFENTDLSVRLNENDAKYVDVIHSNGMKLPDIGYGMLQPVGHVDFYVNGGIKQPGCELFSKVIIL
jgi:pancreatic triacylglycerol lipase